MLRINEDDPKIELIGLDSGGGEIYNYQGSLFTGVLLSHYPSGNLLEEITCVNGHSQGLMREYYENGQLMEESFYKYNRLYGSFTEWDQNGNIVFQNDNGPEP